MCGVFLPLFLPRADHLILWLSFRNQRTIFGSLLHLRARGTRVRAGCQVLPFEGGGAQGKKAGFKPVLSSTETAAANGQTAAAIRNVAGPLCLHVFKGL